jgi:site-specific recombinase XerD
VGLGPVFFPAQGRFGHRPVHTHPLPVNALEFIKLLKSGLPEFEEDSRPHPLLKAIMGRRMRTQLGLVERLPLASRSQDVENGIGAVTIRHAGASTAKAMRVDVDGQQRLQHRPQLIRDAEPRRGAIIWGPLSFSFLGFLSLHTSYFTPFSGYSDRLLEQEGLSLSHRAGVKSTISNFAQFLIEEKRLLKRNPTRGFKLPPLPLFPAQHLSGKQRSILRSLVEQAGDRRGAALFALGYWAGCRVSDLSWLRIADTRVGLKQGTLDVGAKESTRREIVLLNKARKPLYAYLQATKDTERTYVFISQRSERLTEEAIHYWFRTLKEQATKDQWQAIKDITFHDLRQDFAQRAREGGWSTQEVMNYLGLATNKERFQFTRYL